MVSLSSIYKKKQPGATLQEKVKAAAKKKKVAESVESRSKKHNMPYCDETDEGHEEHQEMLTQIEEDDPSLYKKMQNWE